MKMTIEDNRIYDFNIIKKTLPKTDVSGITEYEIPAEYLSRVIDQGDVDCCPACALASNLTAISASQDNKKEYSVAYIYGKHRTADSTRPGMLLEPALKSMLNLGSVPYEMLPQLIEMPEVKEIVKSKPELDEYAKDSAIAGYCKIRWSNTDEKINNFKLAIINYNLPIIIESKTAFPEKHCVMAYGFEERDGYFYVKFQNSWGKNWAKGGRGTIPIGDVSSMYMIFPKELTMPFTDVKKDDWFYNAVRNAYLAGYVNGKDETTFDPNGYITRAEHCAVLDRELKRQNEIHTLEMTALEERLEELEKKIRER